MPTHNPDLDYLLAKQASAWLETMRAPSTAQREAFVAWLKDSPRNVREILAVISIDLAMQSVDRAHLIDARKLAQQIDSHVIPFPAPTADSEGSWTLATKWRYRFTIAAALLLGIGAWALKSHYIPASRELRTDTSEQRVFELEDGSVIHLNTDSRITIEYGPRARVVYLLAGEALFKVRHASARPFRVITSEAVIEDVGTEFNVESRVAGTAITVIEGRVSVTPQIPASRSRSLLRHRDSGSAGRAKQPIPAESNIVSANEEAQIDSDGMVTIKTTAVADAVAWRQRRLVFHEQRLAQIVEEFNRYSHRHIRLEDPAVMQRLYSGVFDADDPESLAQVLARDNDLEVTITAEEIRVKTR